MPARVYYASASKHRANFDGQAASESHGITILCHTAMIRCHATQVLTWYSGIDWFSDIVNYNTYGLAPWAHF